LISASGGIFLLQACAQRPGASATVTIVIQTTATGPSPTASQSPALKPMATPDNNSDSEDTTVNALLCNGWS
jgi:hypothetical protein